jgi:aspartate/methionine/tyrosine aminotransferase
VRPAAGSVGFPRLAAGLNADRFAADLVEAEGVLLLPGSAFGHPGNHVRVGLGREDFPVALARLEAFLDARSIG